MTSGIYKIEHLGRCKAYIGSALNFASRWGVHRFHLRRGTHHSEKLQRAWAKYGEHAFVFRRLIICSQRDLVFYEQRAIEAFDSVRNGFNCAPRAGSSLGYKHSATALAKMKEVFKGRRNQYARGAVMSQETKDKISASNSGRIPSLETLLKLRAARVGKRPALGMKHSAETRARWSATRKGRPLPGSGLARLGKKRGPYNTTRGDQQ